MVNTSASIISRTLLACFRRFYQIHFHRLYDGPLSLDKFKRIQSLA